MNKISDPPLPLPIKTRSRLPPQHPVALLRVRRNSSAKEKSLKGGDPDYEEVGPQRKNMQHFNDIQKDNHTSQHCDLCGSLDAAVRCDKCNQQAFCVTCDETYHGHPKRAAHHRKIIVVDQGPIRPPLPRKEGDGQNVISPPQPPPRRNKKGGILSSTFGKRDQFQKSQSCDNSFGGKRDSLKDSIQTPHFFAPSGDQYTLVSNVTNSTVDGDVGQTLMGSLKKIMGNRPLPAPPDQNIDKRRNSTPNTKATCEVTRSTPSLPNDSTAQTMAVALPQSIMEINRKVVIGKPPSSMPPTPGSAHAQYPKHQVRGQPPPFRKLSLQQFPPNCDNKRASLIDPTPATNNDWEKQQQMTSPKGRSQSVSDDHWNQMLAVQNPQPQGYPVNAAASEVGGVSMARRGFNSVGGNARPLGRGMVSSASVCDLNSMTQQQQQNQHQQHTHAYPGMNSANSFQQLSLVSYDPNMVWMQPSPCPMCQPTHMYPQSVGHGGMKRTTSNLSMNLSSVGSDMTGYPWAGNPHVHHHMPVGYPGYYPAPCHQQMMPPGYGHGSAMSIPDSMRSYNRMHSSPVPSVRSTSHRSHKSSKSRSFSAADGGRRSRNHSQKRSEESDVSGSSSFTDDDNIVLTTSKSNKPGGLAWQCDHCTFINPGHVQACGMCSKVPGKGDGRSSRRGVDRRKVDKRRDRKTESADNAQDLSDYDNQRRELRREARLKSASSVKSSSGKSRKKSHRRDSSCSASGSEGGDGAGRLDKQLRDLKITSRSHVGDYDKLSVTSRTRDTDRERGSLKKEGKRGYRRRV